MASLPEMVGSGSIEGPEENSGAHDPAEGGPDVLIADSPKNPAQNSSTPSPPDAESRDVAQEVGKLLREVLIQLRQDSGPRSHSPTGSDHSDDYDARSETSGETAPIQTETPMIPEVRKVDFERFKNKFHEDDGRYIVDALVAGSRLPQEVREESFKRQERGTRTFSTFRPTVSATSVTPRDGPIRRVRIRSKSILYYLSRLADTSTQLVGTRTFLYPFVPLLYFQEEMHRLLNLLEEKWTPSTRPFLPVELDVPNAEQTNPIPPVIHKEVPEEPGETRRGSPGSGSRSKPTVTLDPGFDTSSTLEEFRSYVAFVDQDLSPLEDRYRDTSHRSITFEELWLLFKPGDYIAATTGPKTLLQRESIQNGKFKS